MAAKALLSERLLVVLEREMHGLERASRQARARLREAGEETGGAAAAKGRIEAVGNVTRTLEKLLELKRLEALSRRGGDEDEDGEAERLREELMRRLRALDARRAAGARLFEAEPKLAEAGE